jgi:hypothetical protein
MIDSFDCGVVTFTQLEYAGLTWVRHDATNKNTNHKLGVKFARYFLCASIASICSS